MLKTDKPASLRLDFLTQATELLVRASPVVSAHIQRSKLASDKGDAAALVDPRTSTCCKSCGQTLIVDWTCNRIRTSRIRRRKPAHTLPIKTVEVECNLCHQKATLTKSKPKEVPRKKQRTLESAPSIATGHVEYQRPSSMNDASLKAPARTSRKSRSNKASLQALVGKMSAKQQQQSSSFGLNFADLLK